MGLISYVFNNLAIKSEMCLNLKKNTRILLENTLINRNVWYYRYNGLF